MALNPAKSSLKPGALIAGKYRLLKQLGRGAAGVVWAALNVTTSRKVALKLLIKPDPKQRERLLREARAAGALHHPNVVDIYDVTEMDGNPVLVLEMLEGQTLQQLIDERGPLPPLEAAGIGRDVARALAVAHASGIVHRDLKPANIFMHQPSDDPPVVKVVDFGISKNRLTGEGTLTETGMAVGSPAFMSPEQVRGERNLDGRTDLWALGVILYEMLVGKRLFDGRTHEVLTQVLVEPIRPIEARVPGIDPAFAAVVHGLLERDIDKRFSSAEEVDRRLATVLGITEAPPRRSIAAPAAPAVVHDTTLTPRPMTEAKKPVIGPRGESKPAALPAPPRPAAAKAEAKPAVPLAAKAEAKPAVPLAAKAEAKPAAPPAAKAEAKPAAPPAPKQAEAKLVIPPAPKAIPKAYVDEEEEEPTHVAPFAMRAALAQKTVPSIYSDDEEEEEGDQTKVAPDAVLTAAIHASRRNDEPEPASSVPTVRPPPDTAEQIIDQNAFPTMRPPPELAEPEEAPGPATPHQPVVPDAPPSTEPAPASNAPVASAPIPEAKPTPASPVQPAPEDVDLAKMLPSVPPPTARSVQVEEPVPSGDLFHMNKPAPSSPGAAAEPSAPPAPASTSTPAAPAAQTAQPVPVPEPESEAPVQSGRNWVMVGVAILLLIFALVIFLTQTNFF